MNNEQNPSIEEQNNNVEHKVVQDVPDNASTTNVVEDVEMVDIHLIQVQAIASYANKMYKSINRIIQARNDNVSDADREFMSKIVERRDFFGKIADICFNSIKPHLSDLTYDTIRDKNEQSAHMSENLIVSDKPNKFISDLHAFEVMDLSNRQILHTEIAANKTLLTPIKVPKAVFTSLNLI